MGGESGANKGDRESRCSIPSFAPLSPPTLESVARALVPLTLPPGTEVIRQGDVGDRFYTIADGEVDVSMDATHVATLGRGDHFGEIALLYDVARTATVRTRGSVRLYALEREHFLAAVTGHAAGAAERRSARRRATREAARAA